MLTTIYLPAGTVRVYLRDAPGLYADALHPELPDGTPRVLSRLQKEATNRKLVRQWCGVGSNFPVALSEQDVRELNEGVWRHLPPLELLPDDGGRPQTLATALPEPEWERYAAAFVAAPPEGWRLIAVWRNPTFEQHLMNVQAREDCERLLKQQAMTGHLTPRPEASGIPTAHMVGRQLKDAFLTVEEFTEFARGLAVDVRLAEPGPTVRPVAESIDYSMLATKGQLIAAFGAFTGMDDSWFRNISDTPKLLAARKVRGQGGRSSVRVEPRFCPLEVALMLMAPSRKKRRPLSERKGWQILRSHFPAVYEVHQSHGPDLD